VVALTGFVHDPNAVNPVAHAQTVSTSTSHAVVSVWLGVSLPVSQSEHVEHSDCPVSEL
jgi:hypothetical protein